ncbi:MAG: dUTP diphosphatase [Pseudomonadota bacterium]
MDVPVTRLPGGTGLDLPRYETAGSAGMDLRAAIDADVVLRPGQRTLVPTGIALALPAGLEAQVRPRSGLALKHGVTVLNAPGTIDADYRGEVGVLLINHGEAAFTVTRGLRIAQLVISEVKHIAWREEDVLTKTQRSDSGFGSTGL